MNKKQLRWALLIVTPLYAIAALLFKYGMPDFSSLDSINSHIIFVLENANSTWHDCICCVILGFYLGAAILATLALAIAGLSFALMTAFDD